MNIIAKLSPLALLFAVACGDGGPVEDVKNCIDVCGNYETCVDSSFEQVECQSRCEGRADYNDAFRAQLAECEACIDQGACAENEDECADECEGIISAST